tara:strand:- start:594 stop:791 length:198 start_codon:yes stop_codon:yes gene_type:complete
MPLFPRKKVKKQKMADLKTSWQRSFDQKYADLSPKAEDYIRLVHSLPEELQMEVCGLISGLDLTL